MDRLTEIRVPPEWESALTDCLDEPLSPPTSLRTWIVAGLALCLAVAMAAGIFLLYS